MRMRSAGRSSADRLMRRIVAAIFAGRYGFLRNLHTLAGALMLVAAGCALLTPKPDHSRFILLASVTPPGWRASQSAGEKLGSIAIGLGPIHLPEYLERPELVIRTSPNGLDLSESDRWAEPLADNFRNVLTNDLSNLLRVTNIRQFPWYPGTHLDFVVQIQVQRFEADTSHKAELIANWELMTGQGNQVVATRQTHVTQVSSSLAGDAVAGALSKNVAELAQDIASAIVEAEHQRIAADGRAE